MNSGAKPTWFVGPWELSVATAVLRRAQVAAVRGDAGRARELAREVVERFGLREGDPLVRAARELGATR